MVHQPLINWLLRCCSLLCDIFLSRLQLAQVVTEVIPYTLGLNYCITIGFLDSFRDYLVSEFDLRLDVSNPTINLCSLAMANSLIEFTELTFQLFVAILQEP